MSAKKARSKKNPGVLPLHLKHLMLLFKGRGRAGTLIVLSVAVFFGLWYGLWQEVGRDVLASEQYWLTRENVEITPPAKWVHRDIRAEVFRDASLDGPLSLMDEDLVERIASAFSLHPWVADVRRVTKHYPARVRVELEYRRPVLMVQVPGGLLPVDAEGVLLPSSDRDFSPIEAGRYPRLVGVDTVPVGPVGTRWGDARVIEGAEIAAALGGVWQQLNLDRIVPSTLVELGHGDEYTYELVTKGGTRVLWGRAPSAEMPGEARAVDKVARLIKYREENGTLEGRDGPQQLDARTAATRAEPGRQD
ncbi:MAG: hypothetical protein A2V98_13780 [Planctomycetes bacterium RBG_16_64_12]|nr:MAG: hypothetical protein A2V98_13780 [Planctomycetes bacterium RBG_16_64_12]